VINKVDLPSAEPERVREQIEQVIGLDAHDAVLASAKSGLGVEEILEKDRLRDTGSTGEADGPLRALLFDSWYDPYRGVMILVRVVDGEFRKGMRSSSCRRARVRGHDPRAVRPKPRRSTPSESAKSASSPANIKDIVQAKIGDTVTQVDMRGRAAARFHGRQADGLRGHLPDQHRRLRESARRGGKLKLNDASFSYEPETSGALGFGFRCGFLGLLHMEIIQERLEREFNLELITSAPGVRYVVTTTAGERIDIENPQKMPTRRDIAKIEEPFIEATILTRDEFVGPILALATDRRGAQKKLEYVTPNRVMIVYEMPLNEVILDFFDKLKSISRGYASLDYQFVGYRESDLVKLDILVNGEPLDALSLIVHKDKAYPRGKLLVEKMKEFIPRQMFEVALQAAIGTRIIARSNVKALRKNVLAKCYGGDITRKRKLLEKQKEGKKRMKRVGKVEIPQEAFLAVLKID
jgi:GTP-binding protein LepA